MLDEFLADWGGGQVSGRDGELKDAVLAIAGEIKDEPGADHSLQSLSRRLGRSRNQTIRLFTRYAGGTPGALLLSSRLDTARSLLLYSSLSIKEIAGRLGYCDQFAFSKQFKARFGLAPLCFRSKASEQLSSGRN